MRSRRRNDPSNLSAKPNPTADPEREAELVNEFKKRLGYLEESYRASRRFEPEDETFNQSLRRLRRSLASRRTSRRPRKRLHPEIEMEISLQAQRLAEGEGPKVEPRHVGEAVKLAVERLTPRRGRPDDIMLEFHVKGLVALIQEFSGLAVLPSRYSGPDLYEPRFAGTISSIVPLIFRGIDESISETRLVNIVRKLRREHAGKELRFLDLFPLYGATVTSDGTIEVSGGRLKVLAAQLNYAIYCPL